MGVQSPRLRFRELDRFFLSGLSQLGDEERILTAISLKVYYSINTKSETQIITICTKQKNSLPKFLTVLHPKKVQSPLNYILALGFLNDPF